MARVTALLTEVSRIARQAKTPLVAELVDNGVRGDSRVIKSARSAAESGFTTIILGLTSGEPEALELDGVTAVLLPYTLTPPASDRARWRRLARWVPAMRALRTAAKTVRTRRRPSRAAARAILRSEATLSGPPEWAKLRPAALSQNIAIAQALRALNPDVMHVHGTQLLPAAIAHEARQLTRGRTTRSLYDSHECVPAIVKARKTNPVYAAWGVIEQEYIRDADLVATVSLQIARVLQRKYSLRQLPLVVTNAPSGVRDPSAPDLRTKLGLADDVPLAVYSGWLAAERGLGTLISALTYLPEVHLAVVCNARRQALYDCVRLARSAGVLDRVHFTGYVPPSQVTQYLSSATVGVIPRKPARYFDLSLPTKYREYLHAGLPLVTCDNKAMAEEVRSTGVGEVFDGGAAELAAALRAVIDDPQRYRRAIKRGLLKEHSWEKQEKVLRAGYRSLAGTSPEAREPISLVPACRRIMGDRFTEAQIAAQSPLDVPFATVSLGIGPANMASQAFYWAEAAQRHLGVVAESFSAERAFKRPAHRVIRPNRNNPVRGGAELATVVTSYTHVLIDGFVSLSGLLVGPDIEPEIAVLRHRGIKPGLIAHGSDIRDPQRHLERVPESYFRHVPARWLRVVGDQAARNREIAASFDGPIFVATPDLLHELPQATWLPLVIDTELWTQLPPARFHKRPRVLHRPSRATPPIKGSDAIVPVLEELDRQGVIEYIPDPGEVPVEEMPALIGGADIVIDQIRTGSYGVAAVEAMAAGRVVVGNVDAFVRQIADPPIVDATPDSLASVITRLAGDPQEMSRLAAEGTEFAQFWHSGPASARILQTFLTD